MTGVDCMMKRGFVMLAALYASGLGAGVRAAEVRLFDRWTCMCEMSCAGYGRAESLTNFPVLVKLGPNIAGFSYAQFKSSTNWDLRFTDDTRTNELAYEVDTWDTDGTSCVWVKVPQLTNNVMIRAYWGRAEQTAPAYATNGAVWTNRHTLVAHDGGYWDSSRVYSHATIGAGVHPGNTNGAIGRGTYFAGVATNVFDWGAIGTVNNAVQASISMWLQPRAGASGTLCGQRRPNGTMGWLFNFSGGQASFLPSGYAAGLTSSTSIAPTEQLSLVTMVFRGGQSMEIYRNGALDSAVYTNTVASTIGPGDTTFCVGAKNDYYATPSYNSWFQGTIDEFRMSREAFSSNWVWACWMNQASNTTFIAYSHAKPPNPLGTVVFLR